MKTQAKNGVIHLQVKHQMLEEKQRIDFSSEPPIDTNFVNILILDLWPSEI